MKKHHNFKRIVSIAVMGIAIKIFLLFSVIPFFLQHYPNLYSINHFPDRYADIAWNVASGKGYRIYADTTETMLREPGYIYILSFFFKFFGKNIIVAKIINIFCSFLTAVFIFKLGTMMKINKTAVGISILLFLFHPAILFSESRAGVESIFSAFLVITVHSFYQARHSNNPWRYALAGIIAGFTYLIRSTVLPFVLIFYFYLLITQIKYISLRRIHFNFVLLFVSFFIVISVWSIRNYRLTDTFIPLGTVLGDSLYQGYYSNKFHFSDMGYEELLIDAGREAKKIDRKMGLRFRNAGVFSAFYKLEDEITHNKELQKIVFSEYITSPAFLVKCLSLNFYKFWFQGNTTKSVYLNILLVGLILIFATLGIFYSIKDKTDIYLLLILMAGFVSIHLPIIAHSRHHVPLIPFLMIFCGVVVDRFLTKPLTHLFPARLN